MNTGKYIFAQLIEFLPQRIFDRIVMKYEGDKYVKHFTCWNQLLVMMFGQLSNRDSLRDLTSIFDLKRLYHINEIEAYFVIRQRENLNIRSLAKATTCIMLMAYFLTRL